MRKMVMLACLLVGTACFVSGITKAQDATTSTDVKDIVRHLALAQEQVQTVRYVWTVKEMQQRWTLPVARPSGESDPAGGPSEDIAIQQALTLTISGDNIRLNRTGSIWSPLPPGGYRPYEGFFCLSGSIAKEYHGSSGTGMVCDRPQIVHWRRTGDPYLAPVTCAYRLFDKTLGLATPDEVRSAGESEHDGHACIVIEKLDEERRGQLYRWFLAKDQGFRPVRYQCLSGGGDLVTDVTMRYEPDDKLGWRLVGWAVSQPGFGYFTEDVRISEIALNVPVSPETFDASFPSGTRVGDRVAGVEYTVGAESLDVTVPGGKSTVSDKDITQAVVKVQRDEGRQRTETATHIPQDAHPSRVSYGIYALIGSAILVAAITVIAFLVRRKRPVS